MLRVGSKRAQNKPYPPPRLSRPDWALPVGHLRNEQGVWWRRHDEYGHGRGVDLAARDIETCAGSGNAAPSFAGWLDLARAPTLRAGSSHAAYLHRRLRINQRPFVLRSNGGSFTGSV